MGDAEFIIDTIERYATVEPGLKRAHAKGTNFSGNIILNEVGKNVLGENYHAVVRLSDTPPNRNVPSVFVPLKGLAIHLNQTNANLVFVTFPYFPWTKIDSIVKIAQYIRAMNETSDLFVKLNLLKYILKVESFNDELIKFIRHLPVKTTTNQTYYNPHYYVYNDKYVKLHVKKDGQVVRLMMETYETLLPISEVRNDGRTVELGTIELTETSEEVIESFDPTVTGLLQPVDDEILTLRKELYEISHEHRLHDGIEYDES